MWRWLRSGQQEWQDALSGCGCVLVVIVLVVSGVVGTGVAVWLT